MDNSKENTGKIQLSFKDAKNLYKDYMATGDKDKMNYLVTGTEYIVQKISKEYLRESGSKYEYDDIYGLTFEYFFKKLRVGSILSAKSFNDLFKEEYISFLKDNLKSYSIGIRVDDISDSKSEKVDKENLEAYADEIIRSLTEPESTALVATGTNVPMVVDKPKEYALTTKGYSSVIILSIVSGIICIAILVLGIYFAI